MSTVVDERIEGLPESDMAFVALLAEETDV